MSRLGLFFIVLSIQLAFASDEEDFLQPIEGNNLFPGHKTFQNFPENSLLNLDFTDDFKIKFNPDFFPGNTSKEKKVNYDWENLLNENSQDGRAHFPFYQPLPNQKQEIEEQKNDIKSTHDVTPSKNQEPSSVGPHDVLSEEEEVKDQDSDESWRNETGKEKKYPKKQNKRIFKKDPKKKPRKIGARGSDQEKLVAEQKYYKSCCVYGALKAWQKEWTEDVHKEISGYLAPLALEKLNVKNLGLVALEMAKSNVEESHLLNELKNLFAKNDAESLSGPTKKQGMEGIRQSLTKKVEKASPEVQRWFTKLLRKTHLT